MSKRLEILKNSLSKKEKLFDEKLDNHISTVKQANGQPLNDKRNGQAILNKWERQNDSLRALKDSIQKTKDAIEREECKILGVERTKEFLPKEITELVDKGILTQWRKYPHVLFVKDVEKARIIWDMNKKVVMHKFYVSIPTIKQKKIFQEIYNKLALSLNISTKKRGSNE